MTLDDIFGHGRDLTTLQMSARAFVLFFVTLALIRIGGMRAFGRKSSFDTIIVITLGAVMSRAIAGVSPAIPCVAASAVLVVVHRALAMLTSRSRMLERIVKGDAKVIYRGGLLDLPRMQRAGFSRADLEEAVRRYANCEHLRDVDEIYLESSGELTVIEGQTRATTLTQPSSFSLNSR